MKTQKQHTISKAFAEQLIEKLRQELVAKYPIAIHYGMNKSKHGYAKTDRIKPNGKPVVKYVDEYINFFLGHNDVTIKMAISGFKEDDFFDYSIYFSHRRVKRTDMLCHDLGPVTNFSQVAKMFEAELVNMIKIYNLK